MIRLGILGGGNIAFTHINNVLSGKCPGVTITAVAERRENRHDQFRAMIPGVAMFNESLDLIRSGLCDAVLVATPHYQHPELTVAALDAGLHVLCEKPAGVYSLQVRDMIAAADRHPELTFAMMFNQRTNCVYRKIKELLDTGALGQLKRVNWIVTDWYRTEQYYASGAWRATWVGEGGGVLLNQCPHQLDLMQWLFGLPKRVHAFLHEGKWHDIEVEDDVTAYLEYENGATGVFITTTGDAPGSNRLEITGTLGRLVCENDVLTFDRLTVDEREWCRTSAEGFEKPPMETFSVEVDGRNLQHVEVLNAFADHIEHGTPLVADGREGLKGLLLSNAIHLSGWTGETVELPFDEARFLSLLNQKIAASDRTPKC